MYNRYVPQPDGSYRRNRMQDPVRQTPQPMQQPAISQSNNNRQPQHTSDTVLRCPNDAGHIRKNPPHPASAGSFLRQLFPGDINTEDLLVIVLLLLMAGDSDKDQGTALLTLALYLFL